MDNSNHLDSADSAGNPKEFVEAEGEITRKETDRKCPDCGATMDFDPLTGGLYCQYCGHKEAIDDKDQKPQRAEELDFSSALNKDNCNWGAKKKTIKCKSCGAVTIYDELELANTCPYCGSNQVMEEQDVDTLAPGGVCTFKIDGKRAGENFKSWLGHKLFCPSAAKKAAKPDQFKGIYVPYWTFDADTTSPYHAQYGIERTLKRGDHSETVTEWHNTTGVYHCFIDDQLVLASTRMDQRILESVWPYDTKNNLAYKPEYLAGFISERYSLGLDQGWKEAQKSIRKKLSGEINQEIIDKYDADSVRSLGFDTNYTNIKYKYLLLPVWMSAFTYKDKVYQFVVNGQTGKVGGQTPISPLRVAIAIIITLLLLSFIFRLGR